MASIRQLAPRASLALHSKQLQHVRLLPPFRYATTAAPRPPPKPRVLEKPERFNPPSHPSRRARPRQYPGPPLSEHEQQAQRVRRYPHMMPPEGTFMHWFLSSRAVHASIALTVLISLIFAIWFSDFYHTTPYRDLLPPNSMFLSHPFSFLARYWDVYRMHVDHVSAETAERRRRKVADVAKRSEYRKAHGIEDAGIFGAWMAKPDPPGTVTFTSPAREGRADLSVTAPSAHGATVDSAKPAVDHIEDRGKEKVYVDFEGKPVAVRKKWLGIF